MTQYQPASVEGSRHRSTRPAVFNRYLWIRTALIHRSLHQIVEYIVCDSSYVSKTLLSNSLYDTFLLENIMNRMH